MKYVLSYRAVEDFLPLARQHYPAHAARVDEFRSRGVLLMVGTFDEPMNGDAMGVFTTRQAAEEFAPATRSWPTASSPAGRCARGTRSSSPGERARRAPSSAAAAYRPRTTPECSSR